MRVQVLLSLFAGICAGMSSAAMAQSTGSSPTPTPSPTSFWAAPTRENAADNSGNRTEQVVASGAIGGGGVGCGPRIRKSWDRLTWTEKDVYIRAIQRAMDDGLYVKFIEIHTEQMSAMEAHRTCMFVYWHRELLLGFENLLRAYGGEFSCITLPYWNYVDQNAAFLRGECSNILDCSPILQQLGGYTIGPQRTVVINGTPVQGVCTSAPPANHFCESSSVSGPMCAGCVPRGDLLQATFPATTSVSSLMRQLFSSPTIDGVANNLEQGVHNTVHSALGGAMGFLEAPADPVFFSHHATIDLLHSIFYQCAVGNPQPMLLSDKLQDARQFVQCPRRAALRTRTSIDRIVLLPQSGITMRSGEQGVFPDPVLNPQNVLSAVFAPLPQEYLGLSDIRDMGAFSYNYEMTGLLAAMFTSCADIRALLGLGSSSMGTSRRLEQDAAMQAESATALPLVEAVVVPSNTTTEWFAEALQEAITAIQSDPSQVESAGPNGQDSDVLPRALDEVERMTCLFYEACRGGVQDFSASFREHFHVRGSTKCRQVVDDVASGRQPMLVADWKEVMTRHLAC